ncbi:MAG: acylphosphatase [Pseudomonadota bacterium]|nr:acylphosphatase [Pseudomonadota bacterium]
MATSSSTTNSASYHAMLTGLVQGVGFRAFVERSAARHGVTGWVRNRGQNKVELMFTASPDQSADFVKDLNQGPKPSTITSVDLREVRTRDFDGFKRLPSKGQTSEPSEAQPLLYRFDHAFLAMCQNLSDALPTVLKKHNRVSDIPSDWGFQQLFSQAKKLGLSVKRTGHTRPRMHLVESAMGRSGLVATRPSFASVLQTTVADDKTLAALAMAPIAQHLPKSWQYDSAEDASELLSHVPALVAKPSRGSTAVGVTTNIRDRLELARAFDLARSADPEGRVQLEEHICGVDLRILFAGDSLIAAYLRFPANVIGDGQSTIAALIADKNEARAQVPGIGKANPIPMNALTKSLLADQDLDINSIPTKGQFVQLGLRPNTADGADQTDITDLIHSDILQICQEAITLLGTDGFWGFDVLSEDFTKSADAARFVICEANNRPFGGVFRHATHGKHHNFFAAALNEIQRRSVEVATPKQSNRPLPALRLADISEPTKTVPSAAPSTLEQALCGALGHQFSVWKPGLLLQKNQGGWCAHDTLAPTQFAEHSLRPRNAVALRQILDSAGCQLMPLQAIADSKTMRLVDLPSHGRLIFNRKWRKQMRLHLTSKDTGTQLAQTLPASVYPIQLEPWQSDHALHVVVLEGRVLATAQSNSKNFQTYERTIPGLQAHCDQVFFALPGLNRARLIFRRTPGPARPWRLQSLSTDLMHYAFAQPNEGPAIDIASRLAERIRAGTDQIRFESRPPA